MTNMPSLSPDKATKIINSAVQRYNKKKIREARKPTSQLLGSNWKDPNSFFQIGIAAYNAGDAETSLKLFERALSFTSSDIALQTNMRQAYGTALSESGNPKKAIEVFDVALEKQPKSSTLLNNRALAFLKLGNMDQAKTDLAAAHDFSPENENILLNYGDLLTRNGEMDEAIKLYEKNVVRHSENAPLHIAIADLKKMDAPIEALKHYRKAISLAPDNNQYLVKYSLVFTNLGHLNTFDGLENDLQILLSCSEVDWGKLNVIVAKHIKSQPAFKEILPNLRAAIKSNEDVQFDYGKVISALSNNLVITALKKIRFVDPEIEKLLETFRRLTLAAIISDTTLEQPLYDLLKALLIPLAHYCFANEYVFNENAFEKKSIDLILSYLDKLDSIAPQKATLVFLISLCYRNCHKLPTAKKIQTHSIFKADPALAQLIEIQITEPLAEQATFSKIPQMTPINDDISLSVREQYEENPYPRWQHLRTTPSTTYATQISNLLPILKGIKPSFPQQPKVLIAGCGTGKQPISTARAFPETQLLAVDLSLASISYAMRKAKELKIKNITFGQADIMELESLERKFHVIECAGVLHHMNDPEEGWRVLCNLLEDDGYMLIGLYSELARKDVIASRAFIKENGYGDSLDDIRRCRKAIVATNRGDPVHRIARHSDFYTASACRDLIFHVQEQRFTTNRIAKAIDDLGLEFLGFTHSRDETIKQFKQIFPDDPFMTDLGNWGQFEEKHPDTFGTMYKFWVRKKK